MESDNLPIEMSFTKKHRFFFSLFFGFLICCFLFLALFILMAILSDGTNFGAGIFFGIIGYLSIGFIIIFSVASAKLIYKKLRPDNITDEQEKISTTKNKENFLKWFKIILILTILFTFYFVGQQYLHPIK